FLYNTLNTIIGLSYKDGEKTREALGNLAIYLRGKLNVHSDQYLVPLKEELELVKAYLEIEKLRYGSKLQVEYDMDQNIFVLIPSLTIQPLVENSIRHGLRMKKEDWQIRISTRRVGEKIYITVEDNGIGMSKEKKDQLLAGNSEGVGFKNVLKKIQRIKNASIELESRESEGTRVIIIMPGGEIL
ncbi:MAG TPA: histidine kinase, partial [Tissierellaceae bacterium]|nr:histidine kinase [Tissierellaceae bacterium]